MSSFKPGGSAAAFTRNGDGNTFPKKISYEDKLVTIVSYDLEKAAIHGKDERGEDVVIMISREAKERNRKFESMAAPFFGHLIDARMEKKIPVGNFVVVEKCAFLNYAKKENGGGKIYEGTRVINCTVQDKEKVYRGIFTVSAWQNRISSVQHWNASSTIDTASVAPRLQAVVDEAAAGSRPVAVGFMLRALVKNGAEYTCVNSTPPIDWVSGEKDESGTETKKGGNITPQYFEETVANYREYLTNCGISFDLVDIMTYKNFKSSIQAKGMDLDKEFGLKRLAERAVKLSHDDTGYAGKVWACSGIIQLTEDEMKREGKNVTFVPRNLAMKLHANGAVGDVRNWVRAPNGEKVRTAENLKLVHNPRDEGMAPAVAMESVLAAATQIEDRVAAERAAAEAAVKAVYTSPMVDPDDDITALFGD
jgi:hypothetical protein